MNDEDMERIYNECIDIVNQSKKKLLEETKNEINNIKTISNSEIKNNENANLNHEVNEN